LRKASPAIIFLSTACCLRTKRQNNQFRIKKGIKNLDPKTEQIDKRDSVMSCHLSRITVACNLIRPTPRAWASSPYPHQRSPGIHGLSLHKVYPGCMSPHIRVSSYLTFSPLPHAGRLFSVALAVFGVTRNLPVRKYGALQCPDFPHRKNRRDRIICSATKV